MSALQDVAEGFVLGLLSGAEEDEIEARIAAPRSDEDRDLARAVGEARDRLLPLDLTARDLPLGPGAWERLIGALDIPETTVSEFKAPPSVETSRRKPTGRGWRFAALTSTAAALALAAVLGWQVFLTANPAVLVVLVNEGGQPVVVLEAYADNRVVVTPLRGAEAGPSQVMQLWTKPDPDGPPVSVGLIQTVARMALRNPGLSTPADGQLYEITLEPPGGSPTGLPTGPVLGVGNAQTPVLTDG